MNSEEGMELSEPDSATRLAALVSYEHKRSPTEREWKKYPDYQGRPPHLRPGPRYSLYPTLTVAELLSTRAVISYLLAREYGFSVADISKVLRCDEDYAQRLLKVGDEIGPDSKPVARMKQAVFCAAKKIVASAAPREERDRIRASLEPAKRKPKIKVPVPRGSINSTEISYIRSIIVRVLIKEFQFKRVNIRPLFEYITPEEVRRLDAKGERLIDRWSPERFNDKITLSAAKAILAKGKGQD